MRSIARGEQNIIFGGGGVGCVIWTDIETRYTRHPVLAVLSCRVCPGMAVGVFPYWLFLISPITAVLLRLSIPA
jgi:hypothetical protein